MRPYPPEFCDAETMAYLLDMSETKFRALVDDGTLPKGVKFGTCPQAARRWDRVAVLEAVRRINLPSQEQSDPFMEGLRHGEKVSA